MPSKLFLNVTAEFPELMPEQNDYFVTALSHYTVQQLRHAVLSELGLPWYTRMRLQNKESKEIYEECDTKTLIEAGLQYSSVPTFRCRGDEDLLATIQKQGGQPIPANGSRFRWYDAAPVTVMDLHAALGSHLESLQSQWSSSAISAAHAVVPPPVAVSAPVAAVAPPEESVSLPSGGGAVKSGFRVNLGGVSVPPSSAVPSGSSEVSSVSKPQFTVQLGTVSSKPLGGSSPFAINLAGKK